MDLEIVILSEVSQTEKEKYHVTSIVYRIQKEICNPVFTASLFTIVKTWKQPKCPSTEEWTHTHI